MDSAGWKNLQLNKYKIRKCVELGLINQIEWKGQGTGAMVRNINNTLHRRGQEDYFAEGIWACTVLKMVLALWKLRWDRMVTFDMMKLWGRQAPEKCVLCNKDEKDLAHLFYECQYSSDVWKLTHEAICKKIEEPTNKIEAITAGAEGIVRKSPIWGLVWTVLAISVWYIWKAWNARWHDGRVSSRLPIVCSQKQCLMWCGHCNSTLTGWREPTMEIQWVTANSCLLRPTLS